MKQRYSYPGYFLKNENRKRAKRRGNGRRGEGQEMTAWEVKLGKRIPVMGELKACLK